MPTYRMLVRVTTTENWFVTSDGTAEQIQAGEASYTVDDTELLEGVGEPVILTVEEWGGI